MDGEDDCIEHSDAEQHVSTRVGFLHIAISYDAPSSVAIPATQYYGRMESRQCVKRSKHRHKRSRREDDELMANMQTYQ